MAWTTRAKRGSSLPGDAASSLQGRPMKALQILANIRRIGTTGSGDDLASDEAI
jgi:hypothetical protein